MNPSTYFGLLAEFGTAHIPITEIGAKYFSHDAIKAKAYARTNKYPFPVFRAGNNASTWMVDIAVFADYLDKIKAKAKDEFKAAKL